ncbi:MAG TPA: DUF3276 family protein [Bacteroidota bacterium]|nr:DUF3276 family protein [Bacteroidota bacterium]
MESIFSKTMKTNDRTYFIDVKEAKNKAKYLTIAESRRAKDGEKKFTRSSVMVFDDHIAEFREAVNEAIAQIG